MSNKSINRIETSDKFQIFQPQTGWILDRSVQTGFRLEHSIPMPSRSFLARMMSGRLVLKTIPKNTEAQIAASEGRHLIQVQLEEGEIAYSKMRRVVGLVGSKFTGLKLSSSLIAFTLGHTILHGIRGPGLIYYESSSRSVEVLTQSTEGHRSFDARSIVCFGSDAEFILTSGKSTLSLTFGDWQLELRNGWVVIDLGNKENDVSGLGSVLRKLYIPW